MRKVVSGVRTLATLVRFQSRTHDGEGNLHGLRNENPIESEVIKLLELLVKLRPSVWQVSHVFCSSPFRKSFADLSLLEKNIMY
jgi:hypothetical protein